MKRTRRASSPADLKNNEAIRLSMYPSAKKPLANELEKIEREDWPAPPALASILPELSRSFYRFQDNFMQSKLQVTGMIVINFHGFITFEIKKKHQT